MALQVVNHAQQCLIHEGGTPIHFILAINGDVWFPALDIAALLGYQNTRWAIKIHVENQSAAYVTTLQALMDEDAFIPPLMKMRKNKKYISESGFYSLAMRSKVPAGERFKRWVLDVALPAIRRNGLPTANPRPPRRYGPISQSELQVRMDTIYATTSKNDVIRAYMPGASAADYAISNNDINSIVLDLPEGMKTADIKRMHRVPARVSIRDLMNSSALMTTIVAEMYYASHIRKHARELRAMNKKQKREWMAIAKDVIAPPVRLFPEYEDSALISMHAAAERKRMVRQERSKGHLIPSAHVEAMRRLTLG